MDGGLRRKRLIPGIKPCNTTDRPASQTPPPSVPSLFAVQPVRPRLAARRKFLKFAVHAQRRSDGKPVSLFLGGVLEGQGYPRTVGGHLAVLDHHIQFDDFGDSQISQGF